VSLGKRALRWMPNGGREDVLGCELQLDARMRGFSMSMSTKETDSCGPSRRAGPSPRSVRGGTCLRPSAVH
jgi:hypothetical protein